MADKEEDGASNEFLDLNFDEKMEDGEEGKLEEEKQEFY